MQASAIYRLPHQDRYVRVEGEVSELYSCADLNGRTGFVVAPFEVKAGQPILLIHPDSVSMKALPPLPAPTPPTAPTAPSEQRTEGTEQKGRFYYAIDFANYHAQLGRGLFRKIVLARRADEPAPADDPEQLFMRACHLYPRMFIALVTTPQSGTWLTATPEILLDGHGHHWRTIALAGTMKLTGTQLDGEGQDVTWSIKNREEQRIVATYIAECLEQFTGNFSESTPRTVRAANLVHLRSDFTFTLATGDHIGDLLQALHPTPAVCGLPKREAFRFIVQNEHTPRRYYSGFMGMLAPAADTHLYVALRCMNIDHGTCHLYAGGGLLRDSNEEQEWLETEAKLETMRRVIRGEG